MVEPLTRQERRDRAWLHAALVFALDMSKDPGRKVGAVVVAPGNRMASFGYNGLVAGMPETEENWARPRKYDLVRHAEKNAMFAAPFDTHNCTLYSTLRPCHDCLGDAINCGIMRVVYLLDPIPYTNQNEIIYAEFAGMLDEIRGLQYDDITMMLYNKYGVQHDRYREPNAKH